MIQVQGNSYRHACVWEGKKREDCDTLWSQVLSDRKISQIKFFDCTEALIGSDMFEKGLYPVCNSKKGKQYNMFIGKNYVFLYQSRQLRKEVTTGKLLENICAELDHICGNNIEEAETLERK